MQNRPKLRDGNASRVYELYPLGDIPNNIICEIGKWIVYNFAVFKIYFVDKNIPIALPIKLPKIMQKICLAIPFSNRNAPINAIKIAAKIITKIPKIIFIFAIPLKSFCKL